CGLAASIVAAFLLYRMGYFAPGRSWKAFAIFACGITAELVTFALARKSLPFVGLFLVYYIVFSAVVFCMVRYGDGSDISARKPVLKLESIGLTERERRFVRAFVEGKSLKQISIETRFSESTIRMAFSTIYRKLGIRRCEDLAVLGERYHIDYCGRDDRRRRHGGPAHEYTGPTAAVTPSETSAWAAPGRLWSRTASSLAEFFSPITIFKQSSTTPSPSPSEQPPAQKLRSPIKGKKKRQD
ncbi:MAG: LuxR C-terminal-related transcriptional regulator, partial [Spirochaetaceae bacterium]|nr:LuxR C-terminal-related transcriptional regulator [Spirochaetaceae bacterium]